jgi:hypothetical protein
VDIVETEAVAIVEAIVADIAETEGADIVAVIVEGIGVVIEEDIAVALTVVMEIVVVTGEAVVEVADTTDLSMKLGQVIAAAALQTITIDAHEVMTVTVVRLRQSVRGDTSQSLQEVTEAHLLVDRRRLIITK